MTYSITVALFCLLFLFSIIRPSCAIDKRVNSIAELHKAINSANPGDRIVLDNGTYTTAESILISRQGTADKPITIEAETTGGVEITGSNGFLVNSPSSYIIIKGFRFTHKTGTFRIDPGATHIVITRNVFECAPVGSGTKPYLNISGDDCEISYNTFENKKDEGQMISVQGPGSDRMAKRTWIHHNYFYNFPPMANNCSAIQIGLSGRSMDSAFCVVEYNLFEKTEGENEGAICHKSCNNIIRYNTFGERSEECSIRHGNRSQVYGNFFISTTGLRFSGDDHLICRNYFENCSKAIVCTNGDGEVKEGSKLTCHDRPDRVQVVGNSMINCRSNYEMPGRNNGLGATEITFSDNIMISGEPVLIRGPYVNPVWKDNILMNTTAGAIPAEGCMVAELNNENDSKIYWPGKRNDTAAGKYPEIPSTLRPLTTKDVGPMAR